MPQVLRLSYSKADIADDRRLMSMVLKRYPHLKGQGRCILHVREPPEGEEDTFELTEEEKEEGPETLSSLEADAEVDGAIPWSPIYSSCNENVKHQVQIRPSISRCNVIIVSFSELFKAK